jgi:hypothetical protein
VSKRKHIEIIKKHIDSLEQELDIPEQDLEKKRKMEERVEELQKENDILKERLNTMDDLYLEQKQTLWEKSEDIVFLTEQYEELAKELEEEKNKNKNQYDTVF